MEVFIHILESSSGECKWLPFERKSIFPAHNTLNSIYFLSWIGPAIHRCDEFTSAQVIKSNYPKCFSFFICYLFIPPPPPPTKKKKKEKGSNKYVVWSNYWKEHPCAQTFASDQVQWQLSVSLLTWVSAIGLLAFKDLVFLSGFHLGLFQDMPWE